RLQILVSLARQFDDGFLRVDLSLGKLELQDVSLVLILVEVDGLAATLFPIVFFPQRCDLLFDFRDALFELRLLAIEALLILLGPLVSAIAGLARLSLDPLESAIPRLSLADRQEATVPRHGVH